MGGCASVDKDPNSVMKLRLPFSSKTDKLVNPSPVKDNPAVGFDRPIADGDFKSQWMPTQPVTTFRDLGSKEDTFFDSQPWLESDCDDDFFSVKGDFTPSRGSTPIHHSFLTGTPRIIIAPVSEKAPGSKPEPSPTDRRKKLLELFRESIGGEQDLQSIITSNQNGATGKLETENAIVTPFVSGTNSVCSSELTAGREHRLRWEKSLKLVQCCFPRLRSGHDSCTESKKGSPVKSIG